MAGSVTVTGGSASEPGGVRALGPMTIQGSGVLGDTQTLSLVQGDNTVPIPAGAVGVVVIPPPTGAATLKLRTSLNSGDGGLPISASQPLVYVFPTPAPTTVILNSSAGQAALASFWMW